MTAKIMCIFFTTITLSAFGDYEGYTVTDGREVQLELRGLNLSKNEVTVRLKNRRTKTLPLDLFNAASQTRMKELAADLEFDSMTTVQFKAIKIPANGHNVAYEIQLENHGDYDHELDISFALFTKLGNAKTKLETMQNKTVTIKAGSDQVVPLSTITLKSETKKVSGKNKITWPDEKGIWLRVGRKNSAGEMMYRDYKNPRGIDQKFNTKIFEQSATAAGAAKTTKKKTTKKKK
jgi:hypothetical protein